MVADVLTALRYLGDRLRHPRSRADELVALRRRLSLVGPARSPAERDAALGLRRLREQVIASFAGVSSCRSCARGHPMPNGRYSGGHCCGTHTTSVFTDEEVVTLRLSGTTPGRLLAPSTDHAGCAFRGPTGCALPAAHRPNICVRFVCIELERELRQRGDLGQVRRACEELARGFRRLLELRAASPDPER